jgi:hypothetical protein
VKDVSWHHRCCGAISSGLLWLGIEPWQDACLQSQE